jgi:hypothetical protein
MDLLNNFDLTLKYNINTVNLNQYKYLIINTRYVSRLHDKEIKQIKVELSEFDESELSFIIDYGYNYVKGNVNSYISWNNHKSIDPNHDKILIILNNFINLQIKDINSGGSVVFYTEGLSIEDAERILNDIGYCYGIGSKYEITNFKIDGFEFLYVKENTESG